jgi:cell shape-determining protein MreC
MPHLNDLKVGITSVKISVSVSTAGFFVLVLRVSATADEYIVPFFISPKQVISWLLYFVHQFFQVEAGLFSDVIQFVFKNLPERKVNCFKNSWSLITVG